MTRRVLAAAVMAAAVVVAGAIGAARAGELPCSLGRYAIEGSALFAVPRAAVSTDTVRHATVIVIEGKHVAIEGVCPSTLARVARAGKNVRVRAQWKACPGIAGRVRLDVRIAAKGCQQLRGQVVARRAGVRRKIRAQLALLGGDSCGASTFAEIERRIFGPRGCRVETCHGSGVAGGLDLRAGRAYDALVGAPATNAAAAAAGKIRVVPGNADASFLVQKLAGTLAADEGLRMPEVGRTLHDLEMELVRAWIQGGAPATGAVAGAPCLPAEPFAPAPALAVPPGGYQLAFEGPVLQPGEEYEGCMWTRVPNDADFAVGRFEFSLNPGTHHFALWEHVNGPAPAENVFVKDTACIAGGARPDGVTISGAPEAPYYVDAFPRGIGRVLPGGSLIGVNPHYHNEFDQPIQVKGWVNLYPVDGPITHVSETLVSTAAALDGRNTFSIFVPPFQTATLRVRYVNTTSTPWSIFELSSHQHQRGTRFTAWSDDGAELFENRDWAHPAILRYDPPLVVPPGGWLEYECEHDNGVTRPIRRCGDSPYDRGCTPGDPVPVKFGVTSVDEMCLITGQYYTE